MLRREFLKQSVACSAAISAFATASLIGAEPSPLQVMFYGGSLPSVRSELEKRVKLQVLVAGQDPKKQGSVEDNVVGLEQLKEADLWIGSANKRNFPSAAQLDHFQSYLVAGKPFVGYRAASHIFQNWLEVDQKVWGAKYGGHHLLNKDSELIVELAPQSCGAPDHERSKAASPAQRLLLLPRTGGRRSGAALLRPPGRHAAAHLDPHHQRLRQPCVLHALRCWADC